LSGRAITTGEVVVAADYDAVRAGSRLAPRDMGSLIAVPLRARGQVIGCLLVGWRLGAQSVYTLRGHE